MTYFWPYHAPQRSHRVFFYPEGSVIIVPRPPNNELLHVRTIKIAVAEQCGLKHDSLCIFGIFLGSLNKPIYLLTDTVPEKAAELAMLRVSFNPIIEARVVEKDVTARCMIFNELKHSFEHGYLLPVPKGKTKEKINKLLSKSARNKCEFIRTISQNFFTYTSRNYLATCKRAIATMPISLSTDLIPIRVAVGSEGLVFFDVSGEYILIRWPWSSVICFRHYEVYIKVLAIYVLVDDVMKKVLRPIFVLSLCSNYLLTLSFYVANCNTKLQIAKRNQCEARVSDRLFLKETCPYYTRIFHKSDTTTGLPEVENIFEIISTELSVYIPEEMLLASKNRILGSYLQRTPQYVYVPKLRHEFEEVEGINIRTLTLIKESEDAKLKVPFMFHQNENMEVKEILNCLGTFYSLPSAIKPEDKFKFYHVLYNGVVKWLQSSTVLEGWVDTLYFTDKTTTKPNDIKVSPPISADLIGNVQSLSLSHNSRKSPVKRKRKSLPSMHPLQKAYHPPQSGSLAPSNTPESWPCTPDSSPHRNASQVLLSCRSERPFMLLQKVAEKLTALTEDCG